MVFPPSARALASLGFALLAAVLAVACGPVSAADVALYRADELIPIGFIGHLSGDLARIGVPMAETTEFAGRGVLIEGHRIEFVRVDSGFFAAQGAAAIVVHLEADIRPARARPAGRARGFGRLVQRRAGVRLREGDRQDGAWRFSHLVRGDDRVPRAVPRGRRAGR